MKTTLALLSLAATSVFADPSVLLISNQNIHHVAYQFMRGNPPQVEVWVQDEGPLTDVYLVQINYKDWDGGPHAASMVCAPNIVEYQGKRLTICTFRNVDANDLVPVEAVVQARKFGEVVHQ